MIALLNGGWRTGYTACKIISIALSFFAFCLSWIKARERQRRVLATRFGWLRVIWVKMLTCLALFPNQILCVCRGSTRLHVWEMCWCMHGWGYAHIYLHPTPSPSYLRPKERVVDVYITKLRNAANSTNCIKWAEMRKRKEVNRTFDDAILNAK